MLIVAGYLVVEPRRREAYLAGCVEVVRRARETPGCLEFSLSADLLDPGRIVVFERWESRAAVEAFRGSGSSDEQNAEIRGADVAEYEVADVRPLT
ncbi:putative quinol monooxygenase [Amycolatopsis sp. NPDC004368]